MSFHDSGIHPNTRPDGPLLHHFRSSSVRKEEVYLEGCWSKCLDEGIRLPCHHLLIPDQNDGVKKVTTGFLIANLPATNDENVEVTHPEESSVADDYGHDMEDGNSTEDQVIEMVEISERYANDVNDYRSDDDGETMNACDLPAEVPTAEHETQITDHENAPSDGQDAISSRAFPEQLVSASESTQPALVTRLGQAVAAVLGPIEDVNRFDCLRRKAKSSHSKYDYEQYMNCLASMKTKVLPQKSVMERGFKELEQAFFVKNNFKSPTLEDMKADENSSKFLKRNKSANALLNVWGIRL